MLALTLIARSYGRYGEPVPIDPPPTPWHFGDASQFDPDDDLVAIGADLEPATLLTAYRSGLFPMPSGAPGDPPYWFCPVRRGVLEVDALRISRSLRRSRARFEIRVNTAFAEVVRACGDPRRPSGWINDDIVTAYQRLHELGWAHSVETWREGRLVGGLYGVAVGGLFAGESMFHRQNDASKVALLALAELLNDEHADRRLIDVQWVTPHLATLGVREISRAAYLARLQDLTQTPEPFSRLGE
jgi:leucyl/phenylalanyl-tRNA--protein transferase